MKAKNRKYYLLNFIFVVGLIVLFINDHYLKLEFSNWFTGKLSDFIGILILPMVLSYLFPKSITLNVLFAGIFFVFWKSPSSQPLIDIYNQITPIKITRVVDYSDLIALCILPISYYFLKKIDTFKIQSKGLRPILLIIPTIFIFMATSPPKYLRYTYSEGKLKCHRCPKLVKYSKEEFLEILSKNNYIVSLDSSHLKTYNRYDTFWGRDSINPMWNYPFYRIDTIVIDEDTITNFQFALERISDNKTKVWINGMDISEEIPEYKVERKLRKYYRRLIKKHIRQSIRANGRKK